jgi:RNA polymerase sigma factor (sigma-70 family)
MLPSSESTGECEGAGGEWFSTTHWSTVLTAGQTQSPGSALALEKLCRTYWYPLYAYVRRRGFECHDAEDLTQEFLARFLARNDVAKASPEKGRFRFYLLAALNHFLSDEWDRSRRLKRGGGQRVVSFDAQAAESRYRLEPRDDWSPDRLFERRWALTVLDEVLTRLGQEYEAAGKGPLFQQMKRFLTEGEGGAYPEAAQALGMSEAALRVAVHRLRRRYGELFRLEIAHTVAAPGEVAEEMSHLRTVLRG